MQKKCSGFTLLEVIIYLAIIGIVISATSVFYVSILKGRSKGEAVSTVEITGARVVNLITQTIHNSIGINSPRAAAASSQLSLKMLDPLKNPTIFKISTGTIFIVEGTTTAPVALTPANLTASVMVFTNVARANTKGIVKFNFTLQTKNTSKRQEFDYKQIFNSSAVLR